MLQLNDTIMASDEKDNFVYAEFTNQKGQVVKGSIPKSDLKKIKE